MQMLEFKAACPYEIGGQIQFETPGSKKCGKLQIMEITDIITHISAKNRHIKFILELDGWYKLDMDLRAADTYIHIANTNQAPNQGTEGR